MIYTIQNNILSVKTNNQILLSHDFNADKTFVLNIKDYNLIKNGIYFLQYEKLLHIGLYDNKVLIQLLKPIEYHEIKL